jgi:hypothetical protein
MIIDRRQLIINELFGVLKGLTITLTGMNGTAPNIPAGHIVHNRNELPSELVPGIILCDADEINDTLVLQREPGRQAPKISPQIMKMTPEIIVVLEGRKPNDYNASEDLNLARIAILAAIWDNQNLQKIVGANGKIVLDACLTDFARNRVMLGQMGISMTFWYPLLPNEIIG